MKENKELEKELDRYVKTKVRLRLAGLTLATGQVIAVGVNTGFSKRKNLGYYFYHKGKKIGLRKKDVEYVGRVEK